jgi:hypothetical protein
VPLWAFAVKGSRSGIKPLRYLFRSSALRYALDRAGSGTQANVVPLLAFELPWLSIQTPPRKTFTKQLQIE